MQLEDLRISKVSFGSRKGDCEGTVSFKNENGAIRLKLNAQQVNEIFRVCADSLVATAKEAANEMTVNIIEHQKVIEGE